MLPISRADVAENGFGRPLRPAPQTSWHTFATKDKLYIELCLAIAVIAADAIATRGRFSFVLTGGNSVIPLYRRLRHLDTRWAAWTIYWSDERCVFPDHADRNSKAAFDAWLSHVPIPGSQILPIPAELGSELGAAKYCRQLADEGAFDLVLLSLGDDGHVASLFLDHVPGVGSVAVHPVKNAPKLPASRVSLSFERLADSRRIVLLAAGATKQRALERLADRKNQPATTLSKLAALDVWIDGSVMQLPNQAKSSFTEL
jgi:6-phosphogluconolactonase